MYMVRSSHTPTLSGLLTSMTTVGEKRPKAPFGKTTETYQPRDLMKAGTCRLTCLHPENYPPPPRVVPLHVHPRHFRPQSTERTLLPVLRRSLVRRHQGLFVVSLRSPALLPPELARPHPRGLDVRRQWSFLVR